MAPGGHARETDAILDDVADLAVGKILRLRRSQIGRLGIEIPAHLGLPAAVVSVANSAAVREVLAGLSQDFRSGPPGVLLIASHARNRQVSHRASDDLLQGRWLFGRAEAPANKGGPINSGSDCDREKFQKKCFPAFHFCLSPAEA